jgi:hypothetical protein
VAESTLAWVACREQTPPSDGGGCFWWHNGRANPQRWGRHFDGRFFDHGVVGEDVYGTPASEVSHWAPWPSNEPDPSIDAGAAERVHAAASANGLPRIVGELRELQAGLGRPSSHPGPRPSLKVEADAGPLPANVVPIAPLQREAILQRIENWKSEVRSMSVNEQLRLAADFLDQKKPDFALPIAKLALANLEKGGSNG